jgi:hypothetical protein
VSMLNHAEVPVQSSAILDGAAIVRISWESIPGQSYTVKTTTNLTSLRGLLASQPTPLLT